MDAIISVITDPSGTAQIIIGINVLIIFVTSGTEFCIEVFINVINLLFCSVPSPVFFNNSTVNRIYGHIVHVTSICL